MIILIRTIIQKRMRKITVTKIHFTFIKYVGNIQKTNKKFSSFWHVTNHKLDAVFSMHSIIIFFLHHLSTEPESEKGLCKSNAHVTHVSFSAETHHVCSMLKYIFVTCNHFTHKIYCSRTKCSAFFLLMMMMSFGTVRRKNETIDLQRIQGQALQKWKSAS